MEPTGTTPDAESTAVPAPALSTDTAGFLLPEPMKSVEVESAEIAEAIRDVPPPRERGWSGWLMTAEWLLKYRDHLLAEIEGGRAVSVLIADLLLVAVLPTAFYGLVTGLATGSLARIVSNPIKLPLMLVFTMCLCLPTLYIFAAYLGSRRTFLQTAAVAFTGVALMGVILAAFAPITWFLTFTAPHAYALHVLVSVAVLALAGVMGVRFIHSGMQRLHAGQSQQQRQLRFLSGWMVLYGLVGAQMGWLLRPFFSASDVWIRQRGADEETVFSALIALLQMLLTGGR